MKIKLFLAYASSLLFVVFLIVSPQFFPAMVDYLKLEGASVDALRAIWFGMFFLWIIFTLYLWIKVSIIKLNA